MEVGSREWSWSISDISESGGSERGRGAEGRVGGGGGDGCSEILGVGSDCPVWVEFGLVGLLEVVDGEGLSAVFRLG